MQVTDVKSKITHAVVGGKQNEIESFGMEDSAEFFHLLSNALYSNKRLASVREPLCNAWDGHIAAGTTHIPIEITVKDSTLTIADKGTGIARDMIKSIYGTYGRSTKKSDLLSTGGFGLGSKAPFSYVDHFEVTSCHGGEKTIYRMSLSNAQVGGKPSIIPIMTVPTTETGLTVSFKLKPGDEEKFKMIIMSVVSAGEMNANLNGIPIMTMPLSKAPYGFTVVKSAQLNQITTPSKIMVRYGRVIYPLTDGEGIEGYYDLNREIDRLNNADYYYRKEWTLILEAEPDSMAVTPSRETLSYTQKTIATANKLIQKATDTLREFKVHAPHKSQLYSEIMSEVPLMRPTAFLSRLEDIPGFDKKSDYDLVLQRAGDFRRVKSLHEIERKNVDVTINVKKRINALMGLGVIPYHLGKGFKKALLKEKATNNFTYRTIIHPLLEKLKAHRTLSEKAVRFYDDSGNINLLRDSRTTHENMLLLRRNVILYYNRDDLGRVQKFPKNTWFGDPRGSLLYRVPRSKSRTADARAFFKKSGMNVYDLTVAHSWEPGLKIVEQPDRKSYVKGPPKPKGLPKVSAALRNEGKEINIWTYNVDPAVPRIQKPEYLLTCPPQRKSRTTIPLDGGVELKGDAAFAFLRLYGRFGGVVTNSRQADKYLSDTTLPVEKWLMKSLRVDYVDNPRMKQAAELIASNNKLGLDYQDGCLMTAIREDPELSKKFGVDGISMKLTQQEKDISLLWAVLKEEWRFRTDMKKLVEEVDSWKPSKKLTDLAQKIDRGNLDETINVGGIARLISNTNTSKIALDYKARAKKILLLAMEGK